MICKPWLILQVLLMATLLSLNARGLRSREKRNQIFKKIKCDVLCLKETKWDEEIAKHINNQ